MIDFKVEGQGKGWYRPTANPVIFSGNICFVVGESIPHVVWINEAIVPPRERKFVEVKLVGSGAELAPGDLADGEEGVPVSDGKISGTSRGAGAGRPPGLGGDSVIAHLVDNNRKAGAVVAAVGTGSDAVETVRRGEGARRQG